MDVRSQGQKRRPSMFMVLIIVAILLSISGQQLPFKVNTPYVETCDTAFDIEYLSLDDVGRGDEKLPCTGYLRYTLSGSTHRVCAKKNSITSFIAERACYTLGVNFYRSPAAFSSSTRQMMLYRCFYYLEQDIDVVGTDNTFNVFTENSQLTDSYEAGCLPSTETADPGMYDCFDECFFSAPLAPDTEDNCPMESAAKGDSPNYLAIGCSDINECVNGVRDNCTGPFFETSCTVRKACGNNTDCTNHVGSFECTCKNGYEYIYGDEMDPYDLDAGCIDVNECDRSPDVCGQAGECINTAGSYLCLCPTRALWDDDTKTCSGPVCGTPVVDPHSHLPETYGLPGEEAVYTCLPGYQAPSGSGTYTRLCSQGSWQNSNFCTDVDECLPSQCDPNAICTNTPGSFSCKCLDGFTGDGLACERRRCPSLPAIPNSVAPVTDGPSHVFGDVVIFTCSEGFTVPIKNLPKSLAHVYGYTTSNSFKLTCGSAGLWQPNPLPLCLPVYCGEPEVVPFSDRSPSGFLLGQTVTYSCKDGYQPENKDLGEVSFTRTCQADGSWTQGTKCVDVDECRETVGICGKEKYCINIPGSYLCSCVPWQQIDNDESRCDAGFSHPSYRPCHIMKSLGFCSNGECSEQDGKPTCSCYAGYGGLSCEEPTLSTAMVVGIVDLILAAVWVLFRLIKLCYWRRRSHQCPPVPPPSGGHRFLLRPPPPQPPPPPPPVPCGLPRLPDGGRSFRALRFNKTGRFLR